MSWDKKPPKTSSPGPFGPPLGLRGPPRPGLLPLGLGSRGHLRSRGLEKVSEVPPPLRVKIRSHSLFLSHGYVSFFRYSNTVSYMIWTLRTLHYIYKCYGILRYFVKYIIYYVLYHMTPESRLTRSFMKPAWRWQRIYFMVRTPDQFAALQLSAWVWDETLLRRLEPISMKPLSEPSSERGSWFLRTLVQGPLVHGDLGRIEPSSLQALGRSSRVRISTYLHGILVKVPPED